jgi:hypothetical protein
VSKHEKHMGKPKPTHERRAPAMPDKVTPKAKAFKARKPFGFSYQYHPFWPPNAKPKIMHRWFASETARDQALDVELKRAADYTAKTHRAYWHTHIKKVELR